MHSFFFLKKGPIFLFYILPIESDVISYFTGLKITLKMLYIVHNTLHMRYTVKKYIIHINVSEL